MTGGSDRNKEELARLRDERKADREALDARIKAVLAGKKLDVGEVQAELQHRYTRKTVRLALTRLASHGVLDKTMRRQDNGQQRTHYSYTGPG